MENMNKRSESIDPDTLKIIFSLIMFAVTFLVCLLPKLIFGYFRESVTEEKKIRFYGILSSMSCFCAGTFLGLAFSDLLPDSAVEIKGFPAGCVIVGSAMLLMLTVNQLMIYFKEQEGDTQTIFDRLRRQDERRSLSEPEHRHCHEDQLLHIGDMSPFFIIILCVSLTIHCLFEGLVIGLELEDSDLIMRFLSILLHKIMVAFGIGISAYQTKVNNCTYYSVMLVFSASSPLGVVLALVLMTAINKSEFELLTRILTSVACGTFLYVVFFEILPVELVKPRFRLLKLFMIILGFSTMVVYISIISTIFFDD